MPEALSSWASLGLKRPVPAAVLPHIVRKILDALFLQCGLVSPETVRDFALDPRINDFLDDISSICCNGLACGACTVSLGPRAHPLASVIMQVNTVESRPVTPEETEAYVRRAASAAFQVFYSAPFLRKCSSLTVRTGCLLPPSRRGFVVAISDQGDQPELVTGSADAGVISARRIPHLRLRRSVRQPHTRPPPSDDDVF